MKIAICDDEILFAQKLETSLLQFFAEQKTVACISVFTHPSKLLESDIKSYDVIFLDVLMGETNGMDIAKTIREASTETILIFVSAFVEYAPKGFLVNAFRYLLKDDLNENLTLCMRDVIEKKTEQQKTFCLKTTEGCIKTVKLSQILYFESIAHNIIVHVSGQDVSQYKMYDALSVIEKQLPRNDFFRVQRSYIVNLRNATEMKGNTLFLLNGETITCNRQIRDAVLKRFLEIQGE